MTISMPASPTCISRLRIAAPRAPPIFSNACFYAVRESDAQLAVEAVGGGLYAVLGLLQGSEDAGHMLQEHPTRAGQSGAARGSHEKLRTQVFFKFLNRTR